jgi:5-methylcytosine-specific restriction protein A
VLVSGRDGFCTAHRRAEIKQQKQTVTEDYKERNRFYQRAAWKRVRALHLSSEPFCRSCMKAGRWVTANLVDHIIPVSHGIDALADNNLQSLCKSCHNAKTLSETNRRGRGG